MSDGERLQYDMRIEPASADEASRTRRLYEVICVETGAVLRRSWDSGTAWSWVQHLNSSGRYPAPSHGRELWSVANEGA